MHIFYLFSLVRTLAAQGIMAARADRERSPRRGAAPAQEPEAEPGDLAGSRAHFAELPTRPNSCLQCRICLGVSFQIKTGLVPGSIRPVCINCFLIEAARAEGLVAGWRTN